MMQFLLWFFLAGPSSHALGHSGASGGNATTFAVLVRKVVASAASKNHEARAFRGARRIKCMERLVGSAGLKPVAGTRWPQSQQEPPNAGRQ
jgi:hypothetical protein